jgi:hypothetical protein
MNTDERGYGNGVTDVTATETAFFFTTENTESTDI